MLSREELAALATSVFGSEWQSALAREKGIAPRTMQRWAKEGIPKPATALAIRAYLVSRRIIDLPLPPSDDADARDDAAHTVMALLLGEIVGAGTKVGWHEAELLAGMLGSVIDRMVDGAGAPAAAETLKLAQRSLREQIVSAQH